VCLRSGVFVLVLDKQIFSTLSIVTNSAILGVTSYGLYFYFPDMSLVESLW
jgi:ABC-type transport system involved in cytochrome c biogenesis permease subunit